MGYELLVRVVHSNSVHLRYKHEFHQSYSGRIRQDWVTLALSINLIR